MNRPSLDLVEEFDSKESDFFYGLTYETLKTEENRRYFFDMAEGFDKNNTTKHEKLLNKLENQEVMEKEIEEYELFRFGGKN